VVALVVLLLDGVRQLALQRVLVSHVESREQSVKLGLHRQESLQRRLHRSRAVVHRLHGSVVECHRNGHFYFSSALSRFGIAVFIFH
jgi:hypothetical protein